MGFFTIACTNKKTNKTKISLNLFLGKFCFKQSEQNLIQSLTNFTQPNFKKNKNNDFFIVGVM